MFRKFRTAAVEWLFEGVPPEDRRLEIKIGLGFLAVMILVMSISLLADIW